MASAQISMYPLRQDRLGREAFAKAAELGEIMMTVTLSNACPMGR